MRTAAVIRDVAADGAGLLRRGVGRELITARLEKGGEFEIDHPRLHATAVVARVDLENFLHPCRDQDDAAAHGRGAARKAGARAARDDRNLLARRQLYDGDDLLRGGRQDNDIRAVRVHDAAIRVISHERVRIGHDTAFAGECACK